jgi:hypothetical protein
MPERRFRYNLADLVMQVAFWALVLGLVHLFWRVGTSLRVGEKPVDDFLTTFLVIEFGFMVWLVVRARRKAPYCSECGRKFQPPKKVAGPPVCPACRQKTLAPAQVRKETVRAQRGGFGAIGCLALVFVGLFYVPVTSATGPWAVLLLPLAGIGASLGLCLAIGLLIAAPALVRARRMRDVRFARAWAAKVAKTDGEIGEVGPASVWYSGPDDPTPMLVEQEAIARRRLDAWLGPPDEGPRPFRLFVFARRSDMVDFLGQRASDLWNLDGVYQPGGRRPAAMTTEVVPFRLGDPARTARSLFVYNTIEAIKGALPAPWLQAGVVGAISSDSDDLARLDRRMRAALARGSAFGVELFTMPAKARMKLIRRWYEREKYARFQQLQAQSWSLVEYLGGAHATPERRGRFRAFFRELGPRDDIEAAIARHFDRGPAALLDDWRVALLARDPGPHGPPPGPVRDALADRLVPLIVDPGAKLMDRIRAVREMGRVAHAFGSDALIELLRDGDGSAIPREEIIWSLEAIAGLVLGDDPDAWSSWWARLPDAARGLSPHAEGQPAPS